MNPDAPYRIASSLPARGSVALAALVALAAPSLLWAQAPCTPGWIQAFGAARVLQSSYAIYCLQAHDDGSGPAVFAGGGFLPSLFGFPVDSVAKWDGVAWHAVGSITGAAVQSLAVFDDGSGPKLHAAANYVGGDARVLRWDGATWSPLGGWFDQFGSASAVVLDLHVFDDGSGPALYAGGDFATVGGVPAAKIARWSGTAWQALGSGSSDRVVSMATFDDGSGPALYAGTSGGFAGQSVAKWSGGAWTPLPGYIGAPSLAVCDHGSGPVLYAGGLVTTLGGTTVNHVVRWTGSSWAPLGTGVTGWSPASNAAVTALGVFDPGTGPELIVGGRFNSAGGLSSPMVARWNGNNWLSMAPGLYASLTTWGSITGPTAFATFDPGTGPALLVAGRFDQAAATGDGDIAMWGCLPPGTLATNTKLGQGCYSPTPLLLTPLSRPIVGATPLTWQLRVGHVPAGAVFGISVWGATDPAMLNLASLGLPGCQLRASPDVLVGPWLPTGTSFTYGGQIPADPTLIGFQLFAQAAVWEVPAVNAFGAITSNGVKGRLGDL